MTEFKLLIGGRLVAGDQTMEVVNPATEEVLAKAPRASKAQLDQAVAAAKAAFPAWAATPIGERKKALNAIADVIEKNAGELARLLTQEQGKPIGDATGEVYGTAAFFRYFTALDLPVKVLDDSEGRRVEAHRKPLGVVGAIVPWNIPLLTIVWKVTPALAAGNTVVLKPDEHAPLLALELMKEFEAAGLPKGVLTVVVGDGHDAGARLSQHPDVRKVGFTGSTEVGKSILGASADNMKRVTLELGGKGPNILLDDADLDVAIDGAIYACMANNGEACEAGTRLLVPSERKDEIVERLVARVATMKIGDPLELATDIGPLITAEQRDRVLAHIAKAQTQGAKVAIGGSAPAGDEFANGYFVEPTILTDVTPEMTVACEEVFGPVLSVLSYETVEEAVAIANDTEYGLSAGVWGTDEARVLDVARQLEAGMVYVNDWHVLHPAYPFGGYKQSGLGREGGPNALDQYTEQKYISVDRSGGVENKAYGLVLGTPA